jgi:ferritin
MKDLDKRLEEFIEIIQTMMDHEQKILDIIMKLKELENGKK